MKYFAIIGESYLSDTECATYLFWDDSANAAIERFRTESVKAAKANDLDFNPDDWNELAILAVIVSETPLASIEITP